MDDLGVPPWIGNLHIYRFFRRSTLSQHTKNWWNWELATNHGSMCQQKRDQTWNSNRPWRPRGSNTNHGNRKPKWFNSGMLYLTVPVVKCHIDGSPSAIQLGFWRFGDYPNDQVWGMLGRQLLWHYMIFPGIPKVQVALSGDGLWFMMIYPLVN